VTGLVPRRWEGMPVGGGMLVPVRGWLGEASLRVRTKTSAAGAGVCALFVRSPSGSGFMGSARVAAAAGGAGVALNRAGVSFVVIPFAPALTKSCCRLIASSSTDTPLAVSPFCPMRNMIFGCGSGDFAPIRSFTRVSCGSGTLDFAAARRT
jgi:hypothetical protein